MAADPVSELCVIEGVHVSVAATKPFFNHDEDAYLVVTARNTTKERRYLGVSGHRVRKGGPRTVVDVDGKSMEVIGIPGYLYVDHFAAFDMRICGNG